MAPPSVSTTESQTLTSFLLSRASLKDILSFAHFQDLFPRDKRSNPQVRLLYRELQLLRNRTCDRVRKNIQMEVRLGARQRRDAEKQRRDERGRIENDAMTGIELFGATATEPKLPLRDLLAVMTSAANDLDTEFETLDKECAEVLEKLRVTVGDLSDLRYGKFATPGTDEQVIHQLENLNDSCERALNPPSLASSGKN